MISRMEPCEGAAGCRKNFNVLMVMSCDAAQFLLRQINVLQCIARHAGLTLEQIEQIGHRLQWIVDLMRDGCGKPSNHHQFFRCRGAPSLSGGAP